VHRHARRDRGRRPVLRGGDEPAEALAPEVDRGLVGRREIDREAADALEQPRQGEAVAGFLGDAQLDRRLLEEPPRDAM
jgi:hypothetical protein